MLFNTHSHINDKTENIEEIFEDAFCNDYNLRSINLPKLKKIHKNDFASC